MPNATTPVLTVVRGPFLTPAKQAQEDAARKAHAAMVLQIFDQMEREDNRMQRDRKSTVQQEARDRL